MKKRNINESYWADRAMAWEDQMRKYRDFVEQCRREEEEYNQLKKDAKEDRDAAWRLIDAKMKRKEDALENALEDRKKKEEERIRNGNDDKHQGLRRKDGRFNFNKKSYKWPSNDEFPHVPKSEEEKEMFSKLNKEPFFTNESKNHKNMGKNVIKINESKLRKIVSESIKKNFLLEEARHMIEESMIAPGSIERVWKWKDGGAYLVKGTDGRYYDVYPSYNDSYMMDSDCDEMLKEICKKIETSFQRHNIGGSAHLYNWDGEGEIIVEIRDWKSEEKFTDKFAQMLKVWMENKGFTLREYDDMYNAYHYIYNDYSYEISDERIQKKLADGYEDCTSTVKANARRMGIFSGMEICKKLDQLSR